MMFSKSDMEIIARAFKTPLTETMVLKTGKKVNTIRFSSGNSKVGNTPAFNLLPICTCSHDAKETCGKGDCYAMKPQRASTIARWARNTAVVKAIGKGDKTAYNMLFSAFDSKLAHMRKKYMRLHVSGDFDNVPYGCMIVDLAMMHPEKVMYTYTKQFDILRAMRKYAVEKYGSFPANLKIMLSAWKGITIPEDLKAFHPVAYVIYDVAEISGKPIYLCRGSGSYTEGHETCASCGYKCAMGIAVAFLFH